MHDGHEDGILRDRLCNIIRAHKPFLVRRKISDGEPRFFERLRRMEDGKMLDLGHNDVLPLLAVRLDKPFECKIIRFCAA